MKKEERLLDALCSVRDKYVMEAAPSVKKAKKRVPRWVAAVVVLALSLTLFLQTAPGAAAAAYVKEQVVSLIETLFPPKEVTAYPEGEPIAETYEAQGREPEKDEPGFAIYIDPESYAMTEENGAYYIRPLIYDPDSPLVCEMVIEEFPDASPLALAQQVHDEMVGKWESVTEIWMRPNPIGLSFNMSEGVAWDSMQESRYFVDNGRHGCFQITTRYFMEAAEGHGMRFYAMLETFTLIAPQEASVGVDSPLLEAIRHEVAFTREQCDEILEQLNTDGNLTQADMNELSAKRYTLWLDTLDKVWSALEQTLSEENMTNLTFEQLEWSVAKAASQQAILDEVGEGSLTITLLASNGADNVEERVDKLLGYLAGSDMIPEKSVSATDPELVVKAFSDAYFSGDTEAMKLLLSKNAPVEIYIGSSQQIHAYKGLDNVIADMAKQGSLHPSVEFLTEEEPDSYTYLSITLIWEAGGWKVDFYGLEK